MFEREITLCKFLRNGLDEVVADIPDERIYERAPGNGHPPIWVLGHLAICGELGEKFSGGDVSHPRWLPQNRHHPPTQNQRHTRRQYEGLASRSYIKYTGITSIRREAGVHDLCINLWMGIELPPPPSIHSKIGKK